MIDPNSIAFDVDGVLADTMTLFLDIAESDYNIRNLRYEDITCYMLNECLQMEEDLIYSIIQRIQDGNYRTPLKPMAGAVEVLTRLGKFYGPLLFVTARPYVGPILDWIHGILPLDASAVKLVTTGSFDAKAGVLQDHHITHFVEDRLETCFQLKEAGLDPGIEKIILFLKLAPGRTSTR